MSSEFRDNPGFPKQARPKRSWPDLAMVMAAFVSTTLAPTTLPPTTIAPTTIVTTAAPTTIAPTTLPTTAPPTTLAPTTLAPTTIPPTTLPPTTEAPTTVSPTTEEPCDSNVSVYSKSLTGISTTQRSYRIGIYAADISDPGAAVSRIRVQFKAGSSGSLHITGASIGVKGSGIGYVDGQYVRLKFDGSNGVIISAGNTVWSDWVLFPWFDPDGDLYVHFDEQGAASTYNTAFIGVTAKSFYRKDGSYDDCMVRVPNGYDLYNTFTYGITDIEVCLDTLTTAAPTTLPTTAPPTTVVPTTLPTTAPPTTIAPTTIAPTTLVPTEPPTTIQPTTLAPTTLPTTAPPTTIAPTTLAPTPAPTTIAPTTLPTTPPPTTAAPTTLPPTPAPTTVQPTTVVPTTIVTTIVPTTVAPTTVAPTTAPPLVCDEWKLRSRIEELELESAISDSLEDNSRIRSEVSLDGDIC